MAVNRSSPSPLFVKPCASPGGLTTTCPASTTISGTDAGRGLARLDDEDLRIWMPVELRADPQTRMDEDHAERYLAVLTAYELVGVLRVIELI